MSVDRDALYAHCEANPGDLACYGALADELDDLGYASIAHAYRWMSRRGIYPHLRLNYGVRRDRVVYKGRKVPARFRWGWHGQRERLYGGDGDSAEVVWGIYPDSKLHLHALPSVLLAAPQMLYASSAAAVMDLAKWLNRLKDVYDVDEPKPAGL